MNRFPRPKGRGSLIFAQDPLHLRHECRSFFAQNKRNFANKSFDCFEFEFNFLKTPNPIYPSKLTKERVKIGECIY